MGSSFHTTTATAVRTNDNNIEHDLLLQVEDNTNKKMGHDSTTCNIKSTTTLLSEEDDMNNVVVDITSSTKVVVDKKKAILLLEQGNDNNNSIHDGENGSSIIDSNLERKIDS